MPDGHESLSWCDLCSDSGLNYFKIKEMSWVQEGVQREQSAEYYQNWTKKFFFRKTNFCICFKGFAINTDPMSLKGDFYSYL